MTDKLQLLVTFVERVMGKPSRLIKSKPLSGWDVVKYLWPLNDKFRPIIWQLRSLPYNPKAENEADHAIEEMLVSDTYWSSISADVWRVLLERHQQAIVVAVANERANNPVMAIPKGFPGQHRTTFVALSLLHSMELPWPPEDRSGFELPVGSVAGSLVRH